MLFLHLFLLLSRIEFPTCHVFNDSPLDDQVVLRAIGVSNRSEAEARARSVAQASDCADTECHERKFDYVSSVATSIPHCWNDDYGTWICLIGADGWCGQGSYLDE